MAVFIDNDPQAELSILEKYRFISEKGENHSSDSLEFLKALFSAKDFPLQRGNLFNSSNEEEVNKEDIINELSTLIRRPEELTDVDYYFYTDDDFIKQYSYRKFAAIAHQR